MNDAKKCEDRSTWAVGGGLLVGLGAGFFLVESNPMAFVGCILGGLGLGLILTAFLSRK